MVHPFVTGLIHYTPEAEAQLNDLDDWISEAATPVVAQRFVRAVMDHIDAILIFPYAGRPRDDIRPGMRTTTFRKRTLIAYDIEDTATGVVVNVIGIFHGGQDWQGALQPEADTEEH